MGDDVPRRLKRFDRGRDEKQGLPPAGRLDEEEKEASELVSQLQKSPRAREPGKEVTMGLALEEVKRFKEKNNRLPDKSEYDQIAESIYAQLQSAEEKKRAEEKMQRENRKIEDREKRTEERGERKPHGRQAKDAPAAGTPQVPREIKPSPGPPAAELGDREIKELSIEDLFGEEKKDGAESKGGSGGIGDEFSLEGLEDESEGISGKKCPCCKGMAQQIIYCHECGAAFCDKCAKPAEQIGSEKKFICPSCGKKV